MKRADWATTGVSEQLFIAHVLHRAEEWAVDPGKICVVQFNTLRNRAARVLCTGELNEQHLSEHPEPAAISAHRQFPGRRCTRVLEMHYPRAVVQSLFAMGLGERSWPASLPLAPLRTLSRERGRTHPVEIS